MHEYKHEDFETKIHTLFCSGNYNSSQEIYCKESSEWHRKIQRCKSGLCLLQLIVCVCVYICMYVYVYHYNTVHGQVVVLVLFLLK